MALLSAALALPLGLSLSPSQAPGGIELDATFELGAVVESHHLATLDNDNDGIRFVLSARADASDRLTQLRNFNAVNPSDGKVFDVGSAMSHCAVGGAAVLDRRRACGIEVEHARGDTSAIRLFTPNFDPAVGGRVILFYLKHYAIFGSHKVGALELAMRKSGETWELTLDSGGRPRRVLGLFIHRASRGIGLITSCLDSSCPAEWTRRPREANDGLPPVWGAFRYYASTE